MNPIRREEVLFETMLPQTRVLIVDDEDGVRSFCKTVLLRQGLAVQTAVNGQAALDVLADDIFDLILIDISMPVMNGLRVLEHVAGQYRQVSPIIMTGYATLESAIKAQDLGAEGFILKPFDHNKLVNVVNKVIERRRLRQDYARLQAHLPLIALSHRLVTEQSLAALAEATLKIAREETHALDAALWLVPSPSSSLDWQENWQEIAPAQLASIGNPPPLPEATAWSNPAPVSWLALDQQGQPLADINQAKILHLLVQTEGHPVGVLSLANPTAGRYFTGKDLDFLTVMSSYLAIGLENRYLYEVIDLARQEWKTIFNTLDDGLLAYRAGDGAISRVNQTMAAWLNTTVEALMHRSVADVPLDEQGHTLCDLVPGGDKDGQLGERYSAEFSSPPWAPGRTFRARVFPLYKRESKEPVEVIYLVEDITQASKIQAQLLQTEKLSALGRLLASLAHEINNPLQALRSGLRLLARPNLDDEKRQRYVSTLDKEVERLIDTTMQTLNFARPGRIGKKATPLNQLLRETLVLVNKQLQRAKVETSLELAANLPLIHVVPDQIKQVFLNLILNAIDAMPTGGALRLTTCYLPNDNVVMVSLTDTGRGIPAKILDRIYEPFFTTKEAGTGLGLSISYSIVEAHGGHIEAQSQVGAGSAFAVYLPIGAESDDGTA